MEEGACALVGAWPRGPSLPFMAHPVVGRADSEPESPGRVPYRPVPSPPGRPPPVARQKSLGIQPILARKINCLRDLLSSGIVRIHIIDGGEPVSRGRQRLHADDASTYRRLGGGIEPPDHVLRRSGGPGVCGNRRRDRQGVGLACGGCDRRVVQCAISEAQEDAVPGPGLDRFAEYAARARLQRDTLRAAAFDPAARLRRRRVQPHGTRAARDAQGNITDRYEDGSFLGYDMPYS